MKKQSVISVRFMLALFASIITLLIYGSAIASQMVRTGTYCYEMTVTAETSGCVAAGTTFPGSMTVFAVHGNDFAIVVTHNYPCDTVPTYSSGNGQLGEDGNWHIVSTYSTDDPTTKLQYTGIVNTTLSCDKQGKNCTGSYFSFYNYYDPNLTPTSGVGYNAGTTLEVPCPK